MEGKQIGYWHKNEFVLDILEKKLMPLWTCEEHGTEMQEKKRRPW